MALGTLLPRRTGLSPAWQTVGAGKTASGPFLAERGGDPDVERLMETFAFMSGSLRQKLEDEFPSSPMG